MNELILEKLANTLHEFHSTVANRSNRAQ